MVCAQGLHGVEDVAQRSNSGARYCPESSQQCLLAVEPVLIGPQALIGFAILAIGGNGPSCTAAPTATGP